MVEKLEWVADGEGWMKTKCSNYHIYTGRIGYFEFYVSPNGRFIQRFIYKTLSEAKEAAQEEDEAICVW